MSFWKHACAALAAGTTYPLVLVSVAASLIGAKDVSETTENLFESIIKNAEEFGDTYGDTLTRSAIGILATVIESDTQSYFNNKGKDDNS